MFLFLFNKGTEQGPHHITAITPNLQHFLQLETSLANKIVSDSIQSDMRKCYRACLGSFVLIWSFFLYESFIRFRRLGVLKRCNWLVQLEFPITATDTWEMVGSAEALLENNLRFQRSDNQMFQGKDSQQNVLQEINFYFANFACIYRR